MEEEEHPWREGWGQDPKHRNAHPNSILARARDTNPELVARILDGMREADEDLKAMERWKLRGFISG